MLKHGTSNVLFLYCNLLQVLITDVAIPICTNELLVMGLSIGTIDQDAFSSAQMIQLNGFIKLGIDKYLHRKITIGFHRSLAAWMSTCIPWFCV